MELLIILVPFSLNVEDSSNVGLLSSSGKTVIVRGEWSSLSRVRDSGNTDVVVASRVKVGDGEGLGVGVQVNPNTGGMDLDGHLPFGGRLVVISPLNGNRVGGLLGNFELSGN